MKKGFTLIELLAVIVILAIIALIATPIILGIIEDARKGASESAAQLIVDNVELAYSTAYINAGGKQPTLTQIKTAFKMDGATMNDNGDITPTDSGITCTTTKSEAKALSVTCTANGKNFSTNAANSMTYSE